MYMSFVLQILLTICVKLRCISGFQNLVSQYQIDIHKKISIISFENGDYIIKIRS